VIGGFSVMVIAYALLWDKAVMLQRSPCGKLITASGRVGVSLDRHLTL
jgi:hypothetical protein